MLDFRKLRHPNSPATPSIEDIKKIIKDIPKGSVVRMGGMTDCFQPIERIKRNTLKTIMLLNKKLDIINKLRFKEISVCDDVQAHYEYFLENVCYNPNDCCNLTL